MTIKTSHPYTLVTSIQLLYDSRSTLDKGMWIEEQHNKNTTKAIGLPIPTDLVSPSTSRSQKKTCGFS